MTEGAVVGRGQVFWAELRDRHGDDVHDVVWLASLPVDERLRVLKHWQRAIKARLADRDDDRPSLRPMGIGGRLQLRIALSASVAVREPRCLRRIECAHAANVMARGQH